MIFDTMVLAYALLGVRPFRNDAADALAKAPEVVVPDSFRAEFTNVLWQWVRLRKVPLAHALRLLGAADALITESVPGNRLWEQALAIAVQHHVSGYDALFVALAMQRNTKLISCDKAILRAFPRTAMTPTDYLA